MLLTTLSKIRSEHLRAGALLVAIIATLSSLYLSMGLGLIPCELCWWQRINMYPLTIILAVSIYHKVSFTHTYVLPLSLLGGSISVYHSYIQIANNSLSCTTGGCSAILFKLFGIFTIPNLAGIAFGLITLCMIGHYYLER